MTAKLRNIPLTCVKVIVLGGIVAAFLLPLVNEIWPPTDASPRSERITSDKG
ncbi:MAG: hypothetical protein VKJ09_07280 [Leptolyngbya sp.]|nr:hypothetical protein [Leptolyngbya sp.]